MPRYKITQHLSGWKVIENSIDAKDGDEALENYNKHGDGDLVNDEWKIIEQEYKVTDTELSEDGDTPTEGVKKWREKNEKEKN